MPLPKEEAWFPVKTHGWGWGPPRRWQGWVVLIGFVIGIAAGGRLAAHHPLAYAAYCLTLGAILTGICYWKGEQPGWRWGD
jgi:hypothetical protein